MSPSGHQHKRHNPAAEGSLGHVAQHVHRVEIQVDALVAHLAAAAGGNEQGVIAHLVAHHGACHVEQSLACRLACGGIFCATGHIVLLKSVGCHHWPALEQLLALTRRDVAHGGEHVGLVGSAFLERVLRLHVQLLRHLVAIVACHVVVEGLAVAADAAPNAGGVGGKHRCHLWQSRLHIEQSHAGGPLVEVCHYPARLLVSHDALDHQRCAIGKDARLVVVAIAMQRVHAIAAPHLGIEFVLVDVERGVVHQHCQGLARHQPSAGLHRHPGREFRLCAPLVEHGGLLG